MVIIKGLEVVSVVITGMMGIMIASSTFFLKYHNDHGYDEAHEIAHVI